LREEELAKELGICPKTLKRWARTGRGPARSKIGRAVFYRRNTVMSWLELQQQVGKKGRQARARA
jgi:hypothetical protein